MSYSAADQRRHYHAMRQMGLCVTWGCLRASLKYVRCAHCRAKSSKDHARLMREEHKRAA